MAEGYSLFIDDERLASLEDDEEMVVVRNYDEAIEVMKNLGCPNFVSFDHDLGDTNANGHEIAKWMVEQDLNEEGQFIPADFEYVVHSQNPIGKSNIEGVLDNYLAVKKKESENE